MAKVQIEAGGLLHVAEVLSQATREHPGDINEWGLTPSDRVMNVATHLRRLAHGKDASLMDVEKGQ